MNETSDYHQDVHTDTPGAKKNSCETNKNIPEPKNLQSQTQNKKQTFVGHLNNDLNIKDLKELFELETTKYLKENCNITMPINRKTGKNKEIVLVLSQDHVNNELLKLNGIEFEWKQFNSRRGQIPLKKRDQQRQRQYHKRPQVVVNNFPENQDTFQNSNVMSGNSMSKNEETYHNKSNRLFLIIFSQLYGVN